MMKNNKSALQRSAYYIGIISFVFSVACIIFIYLKIDHLGWQNPVSASVIASAFFFASVGLVLITIGKTNLPSFKFENPDS